MSFQANIDNTDLQAGDIIEIVHDTPGWTPYCQNDTTNAITLAERDTVASDCPAGTTFFAGKEFRVQQVDERVLDQDNGSIGVSIIAREYAAAVYNAEMLLLEDPAPNTNLPNPLVIGDLNLAATEASAEINGVPKSQIKVTWTNTTFLDTVEIRYTVGNLNATAIAALADNAWAYVSSDGDTEEFLITDLQPETFYQIQARSRNTLGAIGTFGPIGDSDKIEVTTVALDSIAPLDIFITSDAGGVAFKGATPASKEITATAFISGVVKTDAEHNVFNYRWLKDNNVMCLDGNTNDILVGTANIDLSFAGPGTFTQAQCESAGGTFTAGSPNTCTVGGNDIGNLVLGCPVGNRADSENTGSTLTQSNFRTLTLGAEDFTDTTAITCTISNIT